jgi:crotonobetainyl-CoA:carnitine CoA-transferase CaiB-like acyl-CoA transferase
MTSTDQGPLQGLIVVDLGHFYMAPYTTLLLALAGADVIKVEPLGGEHLRFRGESRGAIYPFVMLNSNKRSVTLDLKQPRGRELLRKMIEKADVLVENFAPGVMDRLDLSPAVVLEANPRLIYATGSGFGRSGPYRDFPAADITVQAIAGIMSITGFRDSPPVKTGPAIADFMGGIHLYGTILTALYERERTGKGQLVETALFDSVYPSMASTLGLYFGSGEMVPERTGNRHGGLSVAPYNVYPTSNSWIAIMCFSDAHWRSLTLAMGSPELADDPRFVSVADRADHIDTVDEIVTRWTSTIATTELWATLREHRIPSAPVRDLSEVASDPHLIERGMLQRVDHRDFGPVTLPHSPIRLSEHEPVTLRDSPRLGEHNVEVLRDWLGLDDAQLEALAADGVIGSEP